MKKILILKVGALGDVVRTTYILPGIIEKYKEVEIYWITSKTAYELLKYNEYIDYLIDLNNKKKISELNNIEFDIVISLEDEEKIFSSIEKLKFKKIIGVFREKNNISYTDDLKYWFNMGLISKYGKEKADALKKENSLSHSEIMARGLGILIKAPYFFNNKELENQMKNKLKKMKNKYILIGLNLNAGKRWPSKALKIEEAKKLVELLKRNSNNYILLLGGYDDLEYNNKLLNQLENKENVELLQPGSLNNFAALIGNLDVLICSDTLALHLGISQKIKTISYYAPTSAVEIETFNLGRKVISQSEDYCSYKAIVDTSTITAERIFKEFNQLEINLK